MIHWRDQGVILSVRRHGESAAIVHVLTREHGRHAGLVRGGAGRRLRGVLQAGNEVSVHWQARLAEHLGAFTVELSRARAAPIMAHGDRLAGLTASAAVADLALPEREPHLSVHNGLLALLDALDGAEAEIDVWAAVYVRFELGLLAELGFGLDLSHCAATGATEGLTWVSPRSGRAVSAEAGAPYREQLLRLPPFLAGMPVEHVPLADIRDGLRLTGFFLERRIFQPHGQKEPAARIRFVDMISRRATTSGDILAT
jgi:DNA repair protein RecO (recombination protein O)